MKRMKLLMASISSAFILVAAPALGQPYPDKPITLIVGFPPGGGVDMVARQLADRLGKQLKQQVIVENRAGAAGNIAMEYISHARPDGYVLLMGNVGMLTANPLLYPKQAADAVKKLVPVARLVVTPLLAAVPSKAPASNIKQFIELAKSKPNAMFFGSGGSGNINHLAVELLKIQTGISLTHVPYKGSAPSVTALAANEVQLVVDGVNVVLPQVTGGRARALAITGEKRTPALPDVPTMKEAGYPDLTIYGWQGLFAPAGTPQSVINTLTREVDKALANPDLASRFVKQGTDPAYQNPEAFQKYIASEQARWAKVIRKANIKIE
ncbi:tripartite-type tricarboxylate transporter receptor subunit TctC [Advenella incenata]|uniref:Tripartite-type tricarboxylate transporter receptor subunit TctC n=1 Tax=Advenella incenata TaxID=267800 RepID=A0A4Q7VTP5_9BURK|nr:tripartite tricarboxylate transporter substrate binding protein [Advenella incenata]RZT99892.1 tripartite-type tricarboxylate transporter receptor subunit TctC [Advenella incenata]